MQAISIFSSSIALSAPRRLALRGDKRASSKSSSGRRGVPAVCSVRAQQHGDASEEENTNTIPRRRLINMAAATTALVISSKATGPARADEFANDAVMAVLNRQGKVRHSDDEWKEILKDDAFAYQVLRKEGTERPFSSPLNTEKRKGTFVCAGCGRQGKCARASPGGDRSPDSPFLLHTALPAVHHHSV